MANVDTATGIESPPTGARLRWRMENGRAGELLITAAVLTIGRADDCGMVVDSALVSRVHCRIVAGDDGWTIEDAGSSNGTFVNGYQLTANKRLASGDRIQLGLAPASLEAEFVIDPRAITAVTAADVDRWRVRAEQLQQALTESYEREAAASRAAARATADAAHAHAELTEARDLLTVTRASVAERQQAVDSARSELAAREAAERGVVSTLRAEIDELTHHVRKLQIERDHMAATLASERARADAAERNRDRALDQVADLADELTQLRRLLDHGRG